MYAICRPTTPVNPDVIKDEIQWAIKYGTYTPPRPSPLRVFATSSDYSTATLIAKTLSDRDQQDTEVRVCGLATGISDSPLHISVPAITDLHKEIDAALDAFDGVPADTKEGSQIR